MEFEVSEKELKAHEEMQNKLNSYLDQEDFKEHAEEQEEKLDTNEGRESDPEPTQEKEDAAKGDEGKKELEANDDEGGL